MRVQKKWEKFLVEIHSSKGYEGHWDVVPPKKKGYFLEADLKRIVSQVRNDKRYKGAKILKKPDGSSMVLGVFLKK